MVGAHEKLAWEVPHVAYGLAVHELVSSAFILSGESLGRGVFRRSMPVVLIRS
jgi:hypothetical protein